MSETPRRVGEDVAGHAVGFQVSANTVGIALLPSLAGVLGTRFGLGTIGGFILVCTLLLALVHEWLSARVDGRAQVRAQHTS